MVGFEGDVAGRDIRLPIMSVPLPLGVAAGAPSPTIEPVSDRQWRWQSCLDGSWLGVPTPSAVPAQR